MVTKEIRFVPSELLFVFFRSLLFPVRKKWDQVERAESDHVSIFEPNIFIHKPNDLFEEKGHTDCLPHAQRGQEWKNHDAKKKEIWKSVKTEAVKEINADTFWFLYGDVVLSKNV